MEERVKELERQVESLQNNLAGMVRINANIIHATSQQTIMIEKLTKLVEQLYEEKKLGA